MWTKTYIAIHQTDNYLFKVNNRSTSEIGVKYNQNEQLKTPERRMDVVLVFLLTLNKFHTFSTVSIVDFEQLNSWAGELWNSVTKTIINSPLSGWTKDEITNSPWII